MENSDYSKHLYEPIRKEIALSYIKHEFKKLLWDIPKKYFNKIDNNISKWSNSPEIGYPRDFWNGFHGIAMGFKLKIGLNYLITAENIKWKLSYLQINDLHFGVEQRETRRIREGKLSTKEVLEYYSKVGNIESKNKFIEFNKKLSEGTSPRDNDPIITFQKIEDENLVFSVHDGNRRLAKSILEGKKKILSYIGVYRSKEKFPKNYWIPTSILMDNLFFAKLAYENKNENLFNSYMKILKDMISKSESAKYEMKHRAITKIQPFRGAVLRSLDLL